MEFNMTLLNFKPVAALALVLAFISNSQAAEVMIHNAWARPTVEGQQGGGGFMTLMNHGKSDDKLLSASSTAAARMELHTMAMEGNVMRMRQVPSIEVKAGESVELKPGGLHVMFMGITKPLEKGTKVPVTFVFEKAGKISVDFIVQARTPEAAMKSTEAGKADEHDHSQHKH
jgi:periplasmic copper chaperone A